MKGELEKNIDIEISMLREISNYSIRIRSSSPEEAKLLEGSIESLKNGMKIINDSIPKILESIGGNKLPEFPKIDGVVSKDKKLEEVKVDKIDSKFVVVLKAGDKKRFLKELKIRDSLIKQLKKHDKEKKEKYEEFKASRGYLKLANRYFLKRASKDVESGKYAELAIEIRKSNMEVLLEAYVAMMFFTTAISVFASLIIYVFMVFFSVSFGAPYVSFFEGGLLLRALKMIWIPIAVPLATFALIYIYPSTEKSSIGNKIDQELPFAVIHMNAISGSGIAPSEIFKIIGLSKEYPYLKKEVRKVLNQINLYGYDLVTSLNNAAKTSPSDKLSDLFSGLSTTITSGASMSEFFEKRADNLMFNYRIEREKYTKSVETFLDIYISVVIAAPMIFLLLLVMISLTGISTGFTPGQISILAVFAIALLNTVFLLFLKVKQPTY